MGFLIPRLMHGAACAALLLTAGASIPAEAQIIAPSPLANVVYAEVGGAGGIFSLNYERLTEQGIYFRGGTGVWSFTMLDNVREELRNIVVGATRRFDISDRLGQGVGRIAWFQRSAFARSLPAADSPIESPSHRSSPS